MKFLNLNWTRGFWRLWLVITLPWFVVCSIEFASSLAQRNVVRAELVKQNWCLSWAPDDYPMADGVSKDFFDSDDVIVTTQLKDGTELHYVRTSWGWCQRGAPNLRQAENFQLNQIGLVASAPLLALIIAFAIVWVGRGFTKERSS